MLTDIQRAGFLKRLSALILDIIFLAIVVTGFSFLISALTGYDGYSDTLNECYDEVSSEFGVDLNISAEDFAALSEEEAQKYTDALDALNANPVATKAYAMVVTLTLLITSVGIFLGYLALDFVVPLLFGNGQTLGKKVFGIAVMRTDGVKVSGLMMFIRTVLGKYALETMVPVFIVLMIFFGLTGLWGTVAIGLIAAVQIVLLIVTKNRTCIHDLLAGTVTVDLGSQLIFDSAESMLEYKKKLHAEDVARQDY